MSKTRKVSQVERVYDALKKRIIKQDIKPGEYLDENSLMKDMGVGRTPLRQAVLLLKNENFIEGQPNKTPYIKEFSLDDVKELYEALAILEKNIVYLAAIRISDQELQKILRVQKDHDIIIEKMRHKLDPKTLERVGWEFTDLNFEFHRLIAKASNNRFLYKMHQNIRSQAERYSYITFLPKLSNECGKNEYYLDISKQHHEIIKCLKNRDKGGIGDVIVNHVKYFQHKILSNMLNISYL